MLVDAALAFFHFIFVFVVVAALATEAWVIRLPMRAEIMRLLARVDLFYGVSAGLLVAVGLARVYFGAKGADYYNHEPFFWAKMATFALVGIISIPPTLRYMAWVKALKADPNFTPPEEQIKGIRRYVMVEVHLLAVIVLFAVLMARGIGAS